MTAMTPIQIARARLTITQPFFGTLLCTLPMEEDYSIPTAATNMKKIIYNPDFIATLTQKQVEFVLVHEVMHVALLHGIRLHDRDARLWNFAADYCINWLAKELGFTLIDGVLIDEKYKEMSSEQVYDLLLQDPPPPPPSGGGQGNPGDGGEGGGHEPQEGVLGQDLKPSGAGSEAETERLRQDILGKVAQAATMARQAGKMPGALDRFVDRLLHPQVPWFDQLREYMKATVADDESWSRRNRRFRDVYLPTRYSERMGEIVVIGDISGSITPEELNIAGSEITAVADQTKPERIRVLWADTRVSKEQVFEAGDPLKLVAPGGGGTDMRVPLEHAVQFDPAVVILMTDGFTPWPDTPPPYPLIVCCTTDAEVPIGQVIRMRA